MPILGHENPIYNCIQSQNALTDQSSVREPSLLFDTEGHFRTASSSYAPNSLGRNQKPHSHQKQLQQHHGLDAPQLETWSPPPWAACSNPWSPLQWRNLLLWTTGETPCRPCTVGEWHTCWYSFLKAHLSLGSNSPQVGRASPGGPGPASAADHHPGGSEEQGSSEGLSAVWQHSSSAFPRPHAKHR